MPLWMNGWAWQMVFWMIGAMMIWIALIALVAWLIVRWETRALRRVNDSSLQIQRARFARGEADTEVNDDVLEPQAIGAHP
jgi:uncharacterized membrane protein